MILNTLTHTIGLAAGISQLTKLGLPSEKLSIARIDDDSLLLLKQTQIMCHGNRSRGRRRVFYVGVWNACNGNEVSIMIYAGNNAQQDDRSDVDINICWLPDRLLATHKRTQTPLHICTPAYARIPRAFGTWHAYLVATANLITHVQKRPLQLSQILVAAQCQGLLNFPALQMTVHLWGVPSLEALIML